MPSFVKIRSKLRPRERGQTHTHTHTHTSTHTDRDDRGDFIICPMLCYSNGTDNYKQVPISVLLSPLQLLNHSYFYLIQLKYMAYFTYWQHYNVIMSRIKQLVIYTVQPRWKRKTKLIYSLLLNAKEINIQSNQFNTVVTLPYLTCGVGYSPSAEATVMGPMRNPEVPEG